MSALLNNLESRLRAAFLSFGVAVFVLTAPPAHAQPTEDTQTLSIPQARMLARQAYQTGNLLLADQLTTVLLQQNPKDAEALLIRALAARQAGALDVAEEAAMDAYRASDNPALQFEAAFVVAEIKTRKEQFTRAELWLRRADNVAPDDARSAAAARAFQNVSRLNPLSVQLGFTLRPSDNINNGSEEVAEGFGLLGSLDDPIAAIDASVFAAFTYKLKETPKALTEAYGSIFVRRAFLESGYEDIVPGTTSTEFDYVSLALGLEHKIAPFPELGVTAFRFGYSGGYYRNDHFLSAAEVSLSQEFRQDEGRLFRAGIRLRDEHRFDSPTASNLNTALSFDYFPKSNERLSWSLGTTLTDYNSKAPTVEGHRIELRSKVIFKDTFFGAQPDIAASLSWRTLPEFDYFGTLANGRQDVSGSLRLGLNYTDVSYYGFQPRAEFAWSQTNSEVDLWDTKSFSFGITAVSRF